MRYLLFVTVLWAFSFNLIGEYLAGQVDSYFAVLPGSFSLAWCFSR